MNLDIEGLVQRFGTTTVLDGLDTYVAADFDAALARLSKAGARITRAKFAPFERMVLLLDGMSGDQAIDLMRAKRHRHVLCNPDFELWLHDATTN